MKEFLTVNKLGLVAYDFKKPIRIQVKRCSNELNLMG